jgi:hypothetical protein
MISKDTDLIAEAYLSALQKIHNSPTDPATEDIARVNPEVTDRENVEEPVTVAVAVPSGPEATPAGPSIHPNVEDENEELWMARSNLFCLYSCSKKIHNLVQMGIDLEPWMQEKIAVAASNIEGVMKSIAYEAAEKGIDGAQSGLQS